MMRRNTLTITLILLFTCSSFLSCHCFADRPDPFKPVPKLQVKKAVYHLKMLLITKSNRSAVINNKVVKVGDEVDQARILHIAQDHVIMEKAGSKFRIDVNGN